MPAQTHARSRACRGGSMSRNSVSRRCSLRCIAMAAPIIASPDERERDDLVDPDDRVREHVARHHAAQQQHDDHRHQQRRDDLERNHPARERTVGIGFGREGRSRCRRWRPLTSGWRGSWLSSRFLALGVRRACRRTSRAWPTPRRRTSASTRCRSRRSAARCGTAPGRAC